MRVMQVSWPVSELVKRQPKIDLNPKWQRGPAWKPPRQVLLIDSILRGLDIPKLYLRKLGGPGPYTHDAVDGQQRIRAIWLFRSDLLPLQYPDALEPIEGYEVAEKTYSQLDKHLRDRFDNFPLSIGEITGGNQANIKGLFARLQMGMPLNPAELRNAMDGPMVHWIDAIPRTHEFFLHCKIPDSRYKRQDYVAHLFAMAAYQSERDIKAPDLKKMIREFGDARASEVLDIAKAVLDALTLLAEINQKLGHSITQKWIFVDLGWLIMQLQAAGKKINPSSMANRFRAFEELRKKYTGHPENLMQAAKSQDVARPQRIPLYNYIEAFRTQGATHAHLKLRSASLRAFCT
jgi:hypothetical protein